jgi:hypothetical protein
MVRRALITIVPLLLILFFPKSSYAINQGDVVINEFAAVTAGTATDSDWVELYNRTESEIDLTGWILRDSTESNKKELSGKICPKSFRKFDFSNKLNKDVDTIRIFDGPGDLIDSVSYPEQVPAHQQGQSTGRDPDGSSNWKTFSSPSPTDILCEPPSNPPPNPSSSNIVLSEFMPNPDGGDEWAEVYNPNNFEVDAGGWKIDDIEGGSSPYSIPTGTKIAAQAYAVFSFSAKLNNSGDSIRLLDPGSAVVESYSFGETAKGVAFAKDSSGNWQATTTPTPGAANKITPPASQNKTQAAKSSNSSKTNPQTDSTNLAPDTTLASSSNSATTTNGSGKVAGINQEGSNNKNLANLLIAAGLSFLTVAVAWPILEKGLWKNQD